MRRSLPTLVTLAALLLGACGDDDLTVAVSDDARGARMDGAVETATAGGAGAVPTEPAPAVPADEEPRAAPTPAADGSADGAPAAPRELPEKPPVADAPAVPLGDVATVADEVTPPAVDEPEDTSKDPPLDIPVPEEGDWKPEPPKPPVFKDGEWNTSFDYLGSFDAGLDALAADSPLAQHTPKAPTPEGAPALEKGIPEAVRKMDGQKVRIEGYMIPLKFEDGAVKSFFLSRYMMGCCFGVLPKANEVIEVQMANGKGAYYDAYMPFVVVGTFEIVDEGTSPEFLQSVFRIKADSCEYAEDW